MPTDSHQQGGSCTVCVQMGVRPRRHEYICDNSVLSCRRLGCKRLRQGSGDWIAPGIDCLHYNQAFPATRVPDFTPEWIGPSGLRVALTEAVAP